MRERDVLDLLHLRYPMTYDGGNPPRFLLIEHPIAGSVDDDHNIRALDAIVLDRYLIDGVRTVHGFEVKTTRKDWLKELKRPDKSLAWMRYCHRFWLVVSEKEMVKDGELPPGWGLMAPGPSGQLTIYKPAKTNKRALPLPATANIIWHAIRTDRERRAR